MIIQMFASIAGSLVLAIEPVAWAANDDLSALAQYADGLANSAYRDGSLACEKKVSAVFAQYVSAAATTAPTLMLRSAQERMLAHAAIMRDEGDKYAVVYCRVLMLDALYLSLRTLKPGILDLRFELANAEQAITCRCRSGELISLINWGMKQLTDAGKATVVARINGTLANGPGGPYHFGSVTDFKPDFSVAPDGIFEIAKGYFHPIWRRS